MQLDYINGRGYELLLDIEEFGSQCRHSAQCHSGSKMKPNRYSECCLEVSVGI